MTQLDTQELKPCPFCGGEAEVERRGSIRQSTIYACTNCGCRLETGEVFHIGEQWNQRSTRAPDIGGDALSWRCFHCGEIFTDRRLAEDHFGFATLFPAACVDPLRADETAMRERAMFYERSWREALEQRDEAWAKLDALKPSLIATAGAAATHLKSAARLRDALRACEQFVRVLGLDSEPAAKLAEAARAALASAVPEVQEQSK